MPRPHSCPSLIRSICPIRPEACCPSLLPPRPDAFASPQIRRPPVPSIQVSRDIVPQFFALLFRFAEVSLVSISCHLPELFFSCRYFAPFTMRLSPSDV